MTSFHLAPVPIGKIVVNDLTVLTHLTLAGTASAVYPDNVSLLIGTGSDLTILHNGTDTIFTSTTGDLILDNTSVTGSTVVQLGTDTSATDFIVKNNTGTALLTVDGSGAVTVNSTTSFLGSTTYADNVSLLVGTGSDLTLVHNGTNTTLTSATGDFTIDNTNVTGSTIVQLGTDTSATDFIVKNNTGTALLTVLGDATITTTAGLTSTKAIAGTSVHQTTAPVYNAAGGAAAPTAAQLIGGYIYNGAAGGAVALTLPAVADIQAALAAAGITTAAGLTLTHSVLRVTDANNLTVTAGVGGTVTGVAAVNTSSAVLITVFTGAATATHYVIPT